MSEVSTFEFPATGQQIRMITGGDATLFCVADICRGLQHSNPSVALKLTEDEDRVLIDLRETDIPSLNRAPIDPRMWFVTESGFYALALASQAPGAKAFRRWVTHEVLPAIRRTGRYAAAPVADMALPRSYADALRELAATVEERDAVRAELAAAAPKAEAFEVFMDADGTYSFEQVAKMLHAELGLGRNNLIKALREVGVLTRENLPYQRYAEHFHVVAQSFERTDGRRTSTFTTRVYASGVDFIRRRLGVGQGVLVPVGMAA